MSKYGVLAIGALLVGTAAVCGDSLRAAQTPAGSSDRGNVARQPGRSGGAVQRDEATVRDLVAKYVAARERRDAAAIGALFSDDADQLTSSGEWRRGRDAIVRGALASSERTGGTRTITIETVRFPAPGVAIADGRYEIEGGQTGPRRMWTSFLLTRRGADWRIAGIRNMLPAPPAR